LVRLFRQSVVPQAEVPDTKQQNILWWKQIVRVVLSAVGCEPMCPETCIVVASSVVLLVALTRA
jgi:hypothetical protein